MESPSGHYAEGRFWKKVGRFALRTGREFIEKALVLYYCLQDPETPRWARAVIVGALGYFVFPADAIPDLAPVVGMVDDLGVITAALGTVALHVKPAHWEQARDRLKMWFSSSEATGSEA